MTAAAAAWPDGTYWVHEVQETDPATQQDVWLWNVICDDELVQEHQQPGPAYRLAARMNRERRLRSA